MLNRLEHAKALVECLGRYVAKHDDFPNRENLRVACDYLRLMNDEDPPPQDLDGLIESLDALPIAGSVTMDLKIMATPWAIRARRRAILRRREDRSKSD
jgi:hypothetical protein